MRRYVATPEMRAKYLAATNPRTGVAFTENEADYWGTISQIDMAVGRVRALLQKHGVADNTWVSITADVSAPRKPSPALLSGSGILTSASSRHASSCSQLMRLICNA